MAEVYRCVLFFKGSGDHPDLTVLTHSFATRRSSDRVAGGQAVAERKDAHGLGGRGRRRQGKVAGDGQDNYQRLSLLDLPWPRAISGWLRAAGFAQIGRAHV